jgi:hypothetical protein
LETSILIFWPIHAGFHFGHRFLSDGTVKFDYAGCRTCSNKKRLGIIRYHAGCKIFPLISGSKFHTVFYRLSCLCRLAAVNDALQIRPGMEAVFRYEPAAGHRLPPVSDCTGGLPIADDVSPPASENDANVGGAAGEKLSPRRKTPPRPEKERRNK